MARINDEDYIIAFRADYDGSILSIHSGYDTIAAATEDANRRNDVSRKLCGYDGRWVSMQGWELDYC